jgi:hypothetical protein
MQYTNGYLFTTEQQAINARESVDKFYDIPKTADSMTQNYTDYQFAELNTPQFWYIVYDASLLPILGTATTFEVITPPFPI